MRKILHITMLFSLLVISVKTQAQSTAIVNGPLLTMGQYVAITDHPAPIPDFSAEYDNDEHQIKPVGIVAGTLLLSGGVGAGIAGQILGKKVYSKYLKSAFTDNTDRLRKRVVRYNVMRVAGGICAGAGTFILIFSF
jgi:hypothetical protein